MRADGLSFSHRGHWAQHRSSLFPLGDSGMCSFHICSFQNMLTSGIWNWLINLDLISRIWDLELIFQVFPISVHSRMCSFLESGIDSPCLPQQLAAQETSLRLESAPWTELCARHSFRVSWMLTSILFFIQHPKDSLVLFSFAPNQSSRSFVNKPWKCLVL